MRPFIAVVALVAVCCSAGTGWAHPDSISSTRITIEQGAVRVFTRLQSQSLVEVVVGLDADGDGLVTSAEVTHQQDAIFREFLGHYQLGANASRGDEGTPLRGRGVRLSAGGVTTVDGVPYRMGSVDLELEYTWPEGATLEVLSVHSTLFAETSPSHLDLTTVVWPDGTEQLATLMADSPTRRFDPQGKGAVSEFVWLGLHHILGGWDHLAFVLALLLGVGSLRTLIGSITAFTVAHSITLALVALDALRLGAWGELVEPAIALSIAFVAADILIGRGQTRGRWGEAFVFGLIHGLGFAGFVGRSLLHESAKASALLGFNVGVELGQLSVVMLAVVALWPFRRGGPELQGLAPRPLRLAGAMVLLVLGLGWFFERALMG